MSRSNDPQVSRLPGRSDDPPLAKAATPPAMGRPTRPAIERLQAELAKPAPAQASETTPRGRRKFRDQAPIERRRPR